jgi:hypothetical protein
MYTRHVSIKLRPGNLLEFKRLLKGKILPLLRTQRGFQDEITFVTAKRDQVIAISFWDDQRSAESYNHIGYLDVLRILSSVVECLPIVQTFEEIESTMHRPLAISAESNQLQ